MKATFAKLISVVVALAALGSLCMVGIHAQQSGTKPGAPSLTTKWVGYLAFGTDATMDRIAPGPFPTTDRQVQIGLRSDGVVIWRRTPRVVIRQTTPGVK